MLDVYKAFTELFIDANLVSILDDTHLVTASHLARDVDLHVVAAKSFNLLHEFILFGFIRRDYKRVAEVHFEAGYVPADRDVEEFARALRAVGEPIFGMDATHISMGRLLTYLFDVTERFGMETRTELILLQRTMVVVEGVARSLDVCSCFEQDTQHAQLTLKRLKRLQVWSARSVAMSLTNLCGSASLNFSIIHFPVREFSFVIQPAKLKKRRRLCLESSLVRPSNTSLLLD